MRRLWLHFVFVLFLIVLSVLSILPPEDKLRRGKDLAGGVSLVYQVELKPDDPENTVTRMIDLLKKRVDPKGVLDITMVKQGTSRIEVTMPLPGEKVKQFREAFEVALAKVSAGALTTEQFERLMRLGDSDGKRTAEIAKVAGNNTRLRDLMIQAGIAFDTIADRNADFARNKSALRAAVDNAQAALNAAKQTAVGPEALAPLQAAYDQAQAAFDDAARVVAESERAYGVARDKALATTIPAAEVRRALSLSDKERSLKSDRTQQMVKQDSPRKTALNRLRATHAEAAAELDKVVAAWEEYERNRSTLDDPSDLKRLMRGAGVLEFRIAATGNITDEMKLRSDLRTGGPRSVKSADFGWYKINKLESWYDSAEGLAALTADPVGYFRQRYGFIAEMYDGEVYLLLNTQPTASLTAGAGDWKVARARQSLDDLGRPSIAFEMDAPGGLRMRTLTSQNKGRPMAVLLDDEVYTAPTIQSEIGGNGQITGTFAIEEVNYIVRVLEAGSLAAKLAPEPVSENTIGPELGQDNLQRGLFAGLVAFAAVAAFMICYYFTGGWVATFALVVNLLMILAAMSLNSAKFSLPGIAGVILTFGMAVDANVLIYERMREELQRGNDLRTAVRLAYSKALSAIVDGNVTNLIVCVVLAFTGTPEIKGFAVTMSIGTITTLICQLYVTRLIYSLLVDKVRWKKLSMLPLAIPALNRILHPNYHWMKYRVVFVGFSLVVTTLCFVAIFSRGKDLLDNEFRGGTKVTIQLKRDGMGQPTLRTRAEIEEKLSRVVDEMGKQPEYSGLLLNRPSVIMLNPTGDKASRFIIKTTLDDANVVTKAVTEAFASDLDVQPAVRFAGMDDKSSVNVIRPIPAKGTLRENLEGTAFAQLPGLDIDVSDYVGGGVAILRNLVVGRGGAPSLSTLEGRILAQASDAASSAAGLRKHRVIVLEGTDQAASTAAILFVDPQVRFDTNQTGWEEGVRTNEWAFITSALSRENALAGVESFSPSIAESFTAQAVVAALLSSLLIIVYVWVRFNSIRFSMAAIVATLHDCVVAMGAIAFSGYLVTWAPGVAAALGIREFKLDLNVVAAVLTILGYSLNDTIVIMDRIRETKGKRPVATIAIIDQSLNETISRTFITSGTTVIATSVLYLYGGDAVRPFAFCFLVGVLTGTYSSVAVACPIVCGGNKGSEPSGKALATGGGTVATA